MPEPSIKPWRVKISSFGAHNMDALRLLEKLKAIASWGLHFGKDPEDLARYQQVLQLTEQYYGLALGLSADEVHQQSKTQIKQFFDLPFVGAEAAMFDSSGKILLMKRSDNSKWCIPGGIVNVGETPEQGAIREAWEETGLHVRVLELVGLYTMTYLDIAQSRYTVVGFTYLCEVIDGTLQRSHEDLGLQYWKLEEVPIWHSDMEQKARDAQVKHRVLMAKV
jgi:8-oxo-dGTP pyrophosphatase MutT (NUDIX family)